MGSSGSSSIFGGAKPVDTAAREREIEEKLANEKQHREEKIAKEKELLEQVLHMSSPFMYSNCCADSGFHSAA